MSDLKVDINKRTGKHYLGFGAAAISTLFLFNPDLSVIDILPDAIGYILLSLCIGGMADLCSQFELARRNFVRMAFVSSAKVISIFWIFGPTTTAERPTTMLLLTFTFSVIELILLFPAWTALFEGIVYLASTNDGTAALAVKKNGASVTAGVKRLTYFFISAKAALTTLPEFASLSEHSYDDAGYDWFRFINLFRTAALFAGVIIGIIWLIVILKYFVKICADKPFIMSVAERYEREVTGKQGLFVRREVKTALIAICFAVALCIDIYLDNMNYLPDVFAGLAFVVAFILIRKYYARWKLGIGAASSFAVVSAVNMYMSYLFHSEYTDGQVWKSKAAYYAFLRTYPVALIENLLFLVTALLSLAAVYQIIKQHAGYTVDGLTKDVREERLSAVRQELKKKLVLSVVLATLTAVSGCIYPYIITFPEYIISEVWWIINLVLTLATLVSFISMSNDVSDEVDARYMLN